ncbi:MAG: hypothetical protein IT577_19605 [Verrucomicrobiae bacterium]|nr:hypothetical protein [Verrucomicrobiae bacterium]
MRGFLHDLRSAALGAFALAASAGLAGAGSFWWHREIPAVRLACADVRGLGVGEAGGLEPGRVLWVDARWEQAHEGGHLAGAVCFNEMNWEAQASSLVFAWRPGMAVVAYAEPGDGRSARRAAAIARVAIGLEDVRYLEGDWRQLRAAFGAAGGEP